MKLVVFCPKSEFSIENQNRLSSLGETKYTEQRKEYPISELKKIASGANIIAIDPDNFWGFEKAKNIVTQVAETLPDLKGVALSTTSFGWVDLDYFKKRKIPVSNVPGYSRESVAEHTLALLLGLAKRIFVTDMAQGIGMKVIAHNPSPRNISGIEMKSINEVLSESDALTLHTRDCEEVHGLINKDTISKMKKGVIIVNTVDRSLVNEKDMAEAITLGKVYGYAYEAEDLENTPLAKVENAIGIKGFGWYTKEALENM